MPDLAVFILIVIAMLNHGRHIVSFAIASAALVHLIVAYYIMDLQSWYHLSAIFPSAIVILMLLNTQKLTSLVLDLVWIMFAQMLINAFGWVMCELGQKAAVYNILSAVFYFCIIARLLIRTKRDVREYPSTSNRLGVSKLNIIRIQSDNEGKQ